MNLRSTMFDRRMCNARVYVCREWEVCSFMFVRKSICSKFLRFDRRSISSVVFAENDLKISVIKYLGAFQL